MALADRHTTPASPPRVEWEVEQSRLRCMVGWPAGRPPLAQVLPLFEHLGLVLTVHRPEESADSFVFFRVEDPALDEVLPWLAEAFTAAWQHTVDRDDFASLVLQAHLDARQVQLVRAACQYLRQAGLGASRSYVRGILSGHREFVQHWVEVFEQRFNPDGPSSADSRLAKYADAATTRDEFRVLDWYAGLLEAITRTNYFRRGSDGRPPLTTVFKLDPARLPFATDPAVKVETFVHHPATPASMRRALSAVASRVCAMRIFQPSSVFSLPPGSPSLSIPVSTSLSGRVGASAERGQGPGCPP
jgi:glutamate dehydrogenase